MHLHACSRSIIMLGAEAEHAARLACNQRANKVMWFVFVRGEVHGAPQRSRLGPAMAAPRTPPHPQPLLSLYTLASHPHLSLHSPAFAPRQLPPPTRRRRRWGKVRERDEPVRPLSQSVVVRLIILRRVPRHRRNGELLPLSLHNAVQARSSDGGLAVFTGSSRAGWGLLLGRIVVCCGAGVNLMRV